MEVSQNYGYLIEGPHNKDCSILGSILGSPDFGKLPNGRLSESGPSFCAHENTAPPRYSDYRRNSPPF